jgi:hypothetical protein
MKKLKFNEGGQPIYLDDIQTLQESMGSALCGLVAALLASDWSQKNITTAFLADPTRTKDGSYVGGWVYYDGNLLQYTNNLTPALIDPSGYLNIYKTEADSRVMADGSTANCTETMYATVDSAEDAQALASIDWKTVSVMTELITDVKWKNTGVTLKNGYTGVLKYGNDKYVGEVKMKAELESTASTWEDSRHIVATFNPVPYSGSTHKAVTLYNLSGQSYRVYLNDNYVALAVDCASGMTPADCPVRFIETFF